MSESQGAQAGSPPAGNTSDGAGSQGNSSAGTENTGAQGGGTMIPKPRFDEVNNRAKKAEEALADEKAAREELMERMSELEAKLSEPTRTTPSSAGRKEAALPEPPPGLSQLEQVRWYVNKTVEAETGMSLQEIKNAVANNQQHQQTQTAAQWSKSATAAGLDPSDKKHMAAVTIAINTKQFDDLDAACKFTAESLGLTKSGSAGAGDVPEMEMGGEGTSQFTASEASAKNATEANELARKGKRVRHRSVEDVFANRQKKG